MHSHLMAFNKATFTIVLAMASLFVHHNATAQVHEPNMNKPDWEQQYAPFRIAGNLYYVGTYELASYLITTSQGHILINTGLSSSAEMIRKNIAALGFNVKDIKILLTNQAHFDHLGGMAAIQKMSGAQMMADEGDVKVIEDGGNSDYIMGDNGSLFQPLKVSRVLHDRDTIHLGDMDLKVLHHPGHTKGSCSYLFNVKDGQHTYKVLIANMPKMLDQVEPAGMPSYENVGKDFEYTYSAMLKLKFDLWFAAHASQCSLHRKHHPGDKYDPRAFIDRKGYDDEIRSLHSEYLAKAKK